MHIRLDDFEASDLSRSGKTGWWIVLHDTCHSFGKGLVSSTVKRGIRSTVRFVLTRMIVLGDADGAATRLDPKNKGSTKFVVRHDAVLGN